EHWSYDIGQPVTSSPAVADGKIAIGADDGSLYVFGAKSAAKGRSGGQLGMSPP
ncbi:MAG: PQQ-binding-like beta-propeller repeat protein, partial [Verrucomicrobia bacterium]|nr:PQQ-binding-like beta-propeller repeat protein [Verrucomicrobiota bacterium]